MAKRPNPEPEPDQQLDPQDWPDRFTAPLESIGLVGRYDEATRKVIPFTDEERAEIYRRSQLSFEAKRRQERNR